MALAALGCDAAPSTTDHESRQWYHARVTTAVGNDIPFFLELPPACQEDRAIIANGREQIPVECKRLDGRLTLDFPVYGTSIAAGVDEEGNLEGNWHRLGDDGRPSTMRFHAEPVGGVDPRSRFLPETADGAASPPRVDLSGEWQMVFDSHGSAIGVFDQTPDGVVRGTAIVPSEYGDLRFLAGNVHGTQLSLSSFNGQYAYFMRADIESDGTMTGTFVCCDETRDTFVAERSAETGVVDPLEQVQVISSESRLDFEPLLAPPYAGKPVILEIFGTWCPNCNDLAPLLADLYEDYHGDGLEVVAVAYELSESELYRQERIEAYREKYGVEWEIIFADAAPEELFGAGAAVLSPIGGVPVTLFLNRDRTIQAIYSGFRGPATGALHEKATATFRTLTDEIMATNPGER